MTLTGQTEISNTDDIIDSRDVIARIAWLADIAEDDDELAALRALAKEGEDYAEDWSYGAALIRKGYFETYAQELAEDCGEIPSAGKSQWPLYCIDWEYAARELAMDYTEVDFDGETYLIR